MINELETAVTFTSEKDRRNEIKERLETYSYPYLLNIYKQAYEIDGSFSFVNVFDAHELDNMVSDGKYSVYDIANMIVYGDVDSLSGNLRINNDGNLESVYDYELSNECYKNTGRLAYWLLYNHCFVNGIYHEDKVLLESWDDFKVFEDFISDYVKSMNKDNHD